MTRARLLLQEAHAVPNYDLAFPKLIAAFYPARAVIEIMREMAKAGELQISLAQLDRRVAELVPRHRLIHAVRIRDFHRYGVQGGGRMLLEYQIRIPPLGQAKLSMYPDPLLPRLKVRLSDPSGSCKFLLTSDVVVQDEQEPVAIPYWILLKEYLDQLETFLPEFESLLRKPDAA